MIRLASLERKEVADSFLWPGIKQVLSQLPNFHFFVLSGEKSADSCGAPLRRPRPATDVAFYEGILRSSDKALVTGFSIEIYINQNSLCRRQDSRQTQ